MPSCTRRAALRAAAAPLAAPAILAAQRPARPNILWISAEDLSPDLGCYGDAYAATPVLDRLATQSLRYDRAFSVYGVCAPSRSSIITGQYPAAIGTGHMRSQGVPPPETRCFTEYLREAGYYCTNNVKTDYNFDPPATAWDESSTRAHWRNRPKGMPFFSVMNFTISHESQARPTPEQHAKNTARLTAAQRHDPARATLPPYYPDTPVARDNWAKYYDTVSALDHLVGDVLKQLEEDGLAQNTIVFFWGDHGRGLTRGKRWVYDSGIRVPLLVRWPGALKPGASTGRLVSLMDLGPTVLSLAGIPTPRHMHASAFLGPHAAAPRKYIYAFRDRMDETPDTIRAVRDARFKYIRNYRPDLPYSQHIKYMDEMPVLKEMRALHAAGKLTGAPALWFAPTKPVEELYDCDQDPHEIRNLAADPAHRGKLEELRAAHAAWRRQYEDLTALPETELLERMRPGGVWQTAPEPTVSVANTRTGVRVTLTADTPGVRIAWTSEDGPEPRWQLYTKPVELPAGAKLRAKSCRLGWRDSREVTL
jgi:uncharacterized sulfatase